MEVPGRDVTADPLGPDPGTPQGEDQPAPEVTRPDAAPDAPAPGDDDDGGGESIGDKMRDVVDKVKDAITPDRDKPEDADKP
ncbi:MAG: hypothetical protein JWQ20_691 [Conexibacter sp.]|nr:hypothetical protein [Conexibacter sp.]